MERWKGILKVSVNPNNSRAYYRVAASLCLSPSNTLSFPSANAVFFNGDRAEGTGNMVIDRLSDLQKIADIMVSKFGASVNAWVIQASTFNGPFAVYNDFIPSVNKFGEPKLYSAVGFPASTSVLSLLTNCLEEVRNDIVMKHEGSSPTISVSYPNLDFPKTYIIGFSKGGIVLNQLLMELSCIGTNVNEDFSNGNEEIEILPRTKESFLNSITDVHYVDVGLNTAGAYLTDREVIERISQCLTKGAPSIRFLFHGTPRQWCDTRRIWICNEKDKMVKLLENEAQKTAGKLQVHERFYFANQPPDLQMHFEIIERLDVS